MSEKPAFNFRNIIIFSVLVLIIMLAVSAYGWVAIPDGQQIPVHWGVNGEVDRYGSKVEGLLLIPGLTVLLTALFVFLPRIDPRRANLAQSQKAYIAIWAGTLVLLLVVQILIVSAALGNPVNIGGIVPVAVGILFIVIGNYLPKTRSNFYMGVRTPWTLSSNVSWDKTHRLAGRLFILMGLIMIGSMFMQGALWVWVMMGGLMIMLVVLMAYSYIVWKDDPNRQEA